MHELAHLDLVIAARKGSSNQLFISTQHQKAGFIRDLEPYIKKFHKLGIPENSIANLCSDLFEGMNRQVFNAPIDLFIEQFLFTEYPALRPYQFLSLYALMQEGIKAVTDKKIVDLAPKDILSKSKIYNLVMAIQFKELYGIDGVKDFQATAHELKTAQGFYEEYLQYKDDKEPAEEYELVAHWAADLNLTPYFELIDENEYRTKRTNIDNLLSSIEKDPYDIENNSPYKDRQMDKFQQSQSDIGTNMAVVMFMVDALQYFEGMEKNKIREIAFEIATQGTQGYSPDKKDYRLHTIPGKLFSGYHILAYYYVSWMLAIPDMVSQLKLPYDDEYNLALSMFKPKK